MSNLYGPEKKRDKMPGYTGYIPKDHKFNDTSPKKISKDPKRIIPGYLFYLYKFVSRICTISTGRKFASSNVRQIIGGNSKRHNP